MTTPLRDAAENATAGVPVVRGLEWEKVASHIYDAQTGIGGTYRVRQIDTGTWGVSLNGGAIGWLDTDADAMIFAEHHHAQNILAALNPDFLSALDTARAEIERLKGRGGDWTTQREADAAVLRAVEALEGAVTRALSACLSDGDDAAEINATVFDILSHAEAATLSPAVKEPK